MKRKAIFRAVVAVIAVAFMGGCLNDSPAERRAGQAGSVSFQVSAATSGPFASLADSVSLVVSAPDMLTIRKRVGVSAGTISETILGIPAGPDRLFEVSVFDSAGTLQYEGSVKANIVANTVTIVTIQVVRVVGSAVIKGEVIESPEESWAFFDGFEDALLNPGWIPLPSAVGTITTGQKKNGNAALQLSGSNDHRYMFHSPVQNGEISWWFYDQGYTYFFVVTDTSIADMTEHNLHVTTVVPAGLASNRYSFYYKVGGYHQEISRTAGWHHMVVKIQNGEITWTIDGDQGIKISQSLPVLGFQVGAGTIIDDFHVVADN